MLWELSFELDIGEASAYSKYNVHDELNVCAGLHTNNANTWSIMCQRVLQSNMFKVKTRIYHLFRLNNCTLDNMYRNCRYMANHLKTCKFEKGYTLIVLDNYVLKHTYWVGLKVFYGLSDSLQIHLISAPIG